LATDAAEALVREGVPFRDAHETVATSVREGTFEAPADAGARAAPGPDGGGGSARGRGRAVPRRARDGRDVGARGDVRGPGGRRRARRSGPRGRRGGARGRAPPLRLVLPY